MNDPERMPPAVGERDELPLGRVLGTEDATPLAFWFAVAPGRRVRLDDVVSVLVADPAGAGEDVRFYGVVDQVRRRHEGVQFEGDTELVASGLLPANVSYAAHVLVTRLEPEDFIPPRPGDAVFEAVGEALERALYVDAMDARLAAGVLRSGDPAYLNLDFVDGRKGAHVNISGISGVATKTSYALFLLYSLFHDRGGRRGRGGAEPLLRDPNLAKALVFNVKGEDLLFLDRPNARFEEEEAAWRMRHRRERGRYEACGLPAGPFASCELHAPARAAQRGEALLADVSQREGVRPYAWTLQAFCERRMLPFALADAGDMTNLGFLVGHVEERLHRLARDQRGPGLRVPSFPRPGDDVSPSRGRIAAGEGLGFDDLREGGADADAVLTSFGDLVDFLEFKLLLQGADGEGATGGDPGWVASQTRGTREALIRRLRGAQRHLARLVRGDLGAREVERARLEVLDSPAQVHVVDLHTLPPLAQMFTVGVVLRELFAAKEGGRGGHVFVVLDELNKYAPAAGDSPIKEVLLDIAERGRSLGVILIGAQQTASEVERRIVANAAVRVVGRLDAAESERPEYRFLPASFRLRSTILAPGTMVVQQPDVPTPMLVSFPFPAWATRASEVERSVSDAEAQDVLG